jgi:hypothetical protein
VDWGATPVGAVDSWSPALRNAVDLALHTQFPVTLMWGPEFVLIYNQAFVELIADKHPAALGRRAQDVFPEAWDTIGPMLESVFAGEDATWVEDEPLPLQRHGRLEEAYFTFSYSPVHGAGGAIEGVLDIAMETTRQAIDRRRLATLNALREALGELGHPDEVLERALPLLRADPDDFPRVVITDDGGGGGDRTVSFPLGTVGGGRPNLEVTLSEHLAPDAAYLDYLRLTASLLRQAIDRISASEAERGIATAMQRSLLTKPLEPDHLEVAVRYLPASARAQVGGDWYDSFLGRDGALTVVIGDVTGHDRDAAAAMAQIRNLLRGVSYTTQASPSEVLAGVDGAMHGLGVGTYATAVVARVEQEEGQAPQRTLRWSNAGHPPPVLIAPDGSARLLETRPELLLGLGSASRADHVVTLEPGSRIVFYTDGLVERRGVPLPESFAWLAGILDDRAGMSAEALCDHVLGRLDGPVQDDVALLVLGVR